MPDIRLVETIIAVIIVGMLLYSGILMMDANLQSDPLPTTETASAPLIETGQYVDIESRRGRGTDETVYNSLGKAVVIAGTDDSYVQSDGSIDFSTDANWTVSVWASKSPDAPTGQQASRRAVVSLNGRLIIYHQPSLGQWSAWYYNEGSTNSYIVNVSTGGGQGALQNIQVLANGTHLKIYRNNSIGEVENITVENIEDAPVASSNWWGRLEELRTFDDALDNSQRQQLVDSPVDPLASANRTSRVMFDQAEKSTQLIFFTSASLTQSNVTFDDGHPGSVMDGQSTLNDITGTTDYVWDPDGPRIYTVSGGELDGAPVAYVTFEFSNEFSRLIMVRNYEQLIGTVEVLFTVIVLVIVLSYLLLLRDR